MSVAYNIAELLMNAVNRVTHGGLKAMFFELMKDPGNEPDVPDKLRRSFNVETLEVAGHRVHVIAPKDGSTETKGAARAAGQAGEPGMAVLYLAGGGGCMPPLNLHFQAVAQLVRESGATCYMGLYPLAPAHTMADDYQWLEKVYSLMRATFPQERIAFAGDSSGATLSAGFCARLAEDERPGGLILVSVGTGVAMGEERDVRLAAEDDDPLLSVAMNDYVAETWCCGMDLTSSDANPTHIDYTGFPPVLFFYGTHELFAPHQEALARRIAEARVPVQTVCGEGLCHCWAIITLLPEGKRAVSQMAAFIKRLGQR